MFHSHLSRIISNKISILCFIIILCIPMLELVILLFEQGGLGNDIFDPTAAFYLTGTSTKHFPQILLLWFLPFYLLLLGADDAIQDIKTGYQRILISKIGIKKYYFEKISTAFFIGFLAIFIALMVNLGLSYVIFDGTKQGGVVHILSKLDDFQAFSLEHPYFTILFYIIVTSFLAGLVGSLGASFSLWFGDRRYVYASSFMVWFLFVLNKDSVMLLLQPFSEYSFVKMLPIFFIASVVLGMISLLTCILGAKFHVH